MITPQSLGLHLASWTKEIAPDEFLGNFNEFFADKFITKEWIVEWEIYTQEIPLTEKYQYLQYAALNFDKWISMNFWYEKQPFPQNINPETAILNTFRAIWACFANMNVFHVNFLPDDISLKDRFAYWVRRSLWEDICLNGQDLSGANLSYWDLENANVRYAYFDEAVLFYGRFKNCDFSHTNFQKISMSNTIFEHCFFVHTDFQSAHIPQNNWKGCTFFDANFKGCEMSITDFDDSILTHTNFENTNLTQSILTDTHIFRGYFARSCLTYCDFSRADLTESNFIHSNLAESKFFETELGEVFWENAHVENALVRNAQINQQSKNILVKKGMKFL